jgi:hypothetical protein
MFNNTVLTDTELEIVCGVISETLKEDIATVRKDFYPPIIKGDKFLLRECGESYQIGKRETKVQNGWQVMDRKDSVLVLVYRAGNIVDGPKNPYDMISGSIIDLEKKEIVCPGGCHSVNQVTETIPELGPDTVLFRSYEGIRFRMWTWSHNGRYLMMVSTGKRIHIEDGRWGGPTFNVILDEIAPNLRTDLTFDTPMIHMFIMVSKETLHVSKIQINHNFLVYLGTEIMGIADPLAVPINSKLEEWRSKLTPWTKESTDKIFANTPISVDEANAILKYGFHLPSTAIRFGSHPPVLPVESTETPAEWGTGEYVVAMNSTVVDWKRTIRTVKYVSPAYHWRQMVRADDPIPMRCFFSWIAPRTRGLSSTGVKDLDTKIDNLFLPRDRKFEPVGIVTAWPGDTGREKGGNGHDICINLAMAVPLHLQEDVLKWKSMKLFFDPEITVNIVTSAREKVTGLFRCLMKSGSSVEDFTECHVTRARFNDMRLNANRISSSLSGLDGDQLMEKKLEIIQNFVNAEDGNSLYYLYMTSISRKWPGLRAKTYASKPSAASTSPKLPPVSGPTSVAAPGPGPAPGVKKPIPNVWAERAARTERGDENVRSGPVNWNGESPTKVPGLVSWKFTPAKVLANFAKRK